jgi:hypothetical protein
LYCISLDHVRPSRRRPHTLLCNWFIVVCRRNKWYVIIDELLSTVSLSDHTWEKLLVYK